MTYVMEIDRAPINRELMMEEGPPKNSDSENRVDSLFQTFIEKSNSASCSLFNMRSTVNKNNFWIMPQAMLNMFATFMMDSGEKSKEARQQIRQLLEVNDDFSEKDWQDCFAEWSKRLAEGAVNAEDKEKAFYQLRVALGVAIDGADLNTVTREKLSKEIESLPWTVEDINKWASEKTNGLIKKLVESVGGDQQFAILTAAYIKGNWEYPFEKKKNSEETFKNRDGSKSRFVQMNMSADQLRMGYASGVEILELPMQGNLSMLFFKGNADKVEQFIGGEGEKSFSEWLKDYESRLYESSGLSLGVPRATLQDVKDLMTELKETDLMKAMKKADWTDMSTSAQECVLGEMKAAGHLIINEEGAEAAQVTFSPTYCESCDPYFYIRSPFAVAMVDRKHKALLGLGMLNQFPKEPEGETNS